jgi:uncharacterized membrane protein
MMIMMMMMIIIIIIVIIMRYKRSYRKTIKHNSYRREGKIRERRE